MVGEVIWRTVVFVLLGAIAVINWLSVKDPPRGESRGINTVLAVVFTGVALLALSTLIGVITGG